MSDDTAPKEIALNSIVSSSDHTHEEDDLKTLKLRECDLDQFASHFEVAFQGSSRSLTVLVALLQRLCDVEKLRQQKQTGIWIEDIVGRLTRRLYMSSQPGCDAASRFRAEASELAEHIFSEALRVANES